MLLIENNEYEKELVYLLLLLSIFEKQKLMSYNFYYILVGKNNAKIQTNFQVKKSGSRQIRKKKHLGHTQKNTKKAHIESFGP